MHVEFRPAAADTGIVFVRRDLTPAARIKAVGGQSHRDAAPHHAYARARPASKWSST